jgi:Ca2+-binding RTX toxin-like protein
VFDYFDDFSVEEKMSLVVHFYRGGIVIAEASASAASALFNFIGEGITAGAQYVGHAQDAQALWDQVHAWGENDAREAAKIITSTAFGTAATILMIEGGVAAGVIGAAAAAAGIAISPALLTAAVAVAAVAAGYYAGEYFAWAFDELVRRGEVLGAALYDLGDSPDPSGLTNDRFLAARAVVLQRDPLVLDLDGDGLELSAASGNVLFDHNADGIKTGTGWARPDDGFLVRDLNGNGSIDSGRELFGVDTVKSNGQLATQGFDALADLDANGDGQITSADAAWGQLQVWRDVNQDGISQAGELSGLDALGITRIGLNGSSTGPQAGQTINNNRVALSTTFTRNCVDRTVGAIDLEANGFFSEIPPEVVDEEGNPVVISEAANALPQMNGSGMVRNLRAAMSLAGTQADELEAAVAAFSAAATRDGQLALIDDLITEWAQTSSYWSDLEGYLGNSVTLTPPPGVSAAQYRNLISVLEVFNGTRFYGTVGETMRVGQSATVVNGQAAYTLTPPELQLELLQNAYNALRESVYGALVMQTRLKPYLDAVALTIDETGVHFDVSGIDSLVQARASADPLNAVADLLDMHWHGNQAMTAVGWSPAQGLIDTLPQVDFTPEMAALLQSERAVWLGDQATTYTVNQTTAGFLVLGNALNNTITGVDTGMHSGSERLYGGAGNDTLISVGNGDLLDGGEGDDILKLHSSVNQNTFFVGGKGNDTMTGGSYADHYYFYRGDGSDTITDGGQSSHIDTLRFGDGIVASDVSARRSGNDMVIVVAGQAGDQITVKNWFGVAAGQHEIESVMFVDGTTWTASQLTQFALSAVNTGTAGNDTLEGTFHHVDRLIGGDGNDVLRANGSFDVLEGGAGNDTLGRVTSAISGTTFNGGTGNDIITGTDYYDTYIYNRGDGSDVITDSGSTNYQDSFRFGEDIVLEDIGARRSGNDMVITVAGVAGDQITVKNWFANATGQNQIEAMIFSDGSYRLADYLTQLALTTSNTGTAGNDVLDGSQHYVDHLIGGEGSDTLRASGNGDILEGGAGNDTLGRVTSAISGTTFNGGTGNDTITGTDYYDAYIYNRGDGSDVITDSGSTNYQDSFRFGEGIVLEDIGARRSGNDMVITVAGQAGDQITVKNWFGNATGQNQIEAMIFADGSYRLADYLTQLALTTSNTGTSGNDVLDGSQHYVDRLIGGEGDDILKANGNGDTLEGGAGNDTLGRVTGAISGTTFIGGTGNDTIQGTDYFDVYRFDRGDGSDVITDTGSSAYTDAIAFGAGIADQDLWFSRTSNHLLVQVMGDGGQMQINNWFLGENHRIEAMVLSDGQKLLANQVDALVNAMAAFAPPAPGQTTLTPEQQTALAPVIAAAWN